MNRRTRALIDRADRLFGPGSLSAAALRASDIACSNITNGVECGHSPDEHVEPGGCLVPIGDGIDVFCPCERYEVAR